MNKPIIVHGYVCIDEIAQKPRLMRPGEIATENTITTSIGGVIGNTGSALARLGRQVTLVGRLGDDSRAALVKDHFERLGATPNFITDRNYPTSVSIVLIDPQNQGERDIIHNPGANLGTKVEDLKRRDLKKAQHYHFGYLFLSKGVDVAGLLSEARNTGLTTSFDTHGNPTLQDKDEFERCARLSTIVFPSYDEIKAITGMQNPRDMCEYLHSLGPEVAGVKLGKEGAMLIDKNSRKYYYPTYRLPAKSTLGAGDSFFAGVIDAFLDGKSIRDTLLWANATGTACVQGISTEKISKAEVERIQKEVPLEPLGSLAKKYNLEIYQN